MSRLVVVSNRVSRPALDGKAKGGLAVGLGQALKQRGGIWFGWNGARTDSCVQMPECATSNNVTYATQPLTEAEYQQYYLGFSNRVLWPALHERPDLIHEEPDYRACYEAVNFRFACQLCEMLKPDDHIWIHDYHLLPLAAYLRALGVSNRVGFFLHTPFPSLDTLKHVDDVEPLLASLLACDVVGLQTQSDATRFRRACAPIAGVRQNHAGGLLFRSRRVDVDAFPIGVDFQNIRDECRRHAGVRNLPWQDDASEFGRSIVGIDRLDYSKGIPERLRGYGRYLDRYRPHQPLSLIQIAQPSRDAIPEYAQLNRETQRLVQALNRRNNAESPSAGLLFHNQGLPRNEVLALLRSADVGLVTPLRDGMNLVAKEFVAAQDAENPGVLVLSHGAGAAQELDAALKVNPSDPDCIAHALHQALSMPLAQRRERWRWLVNVVEDNDIERWATGFLERLATQRLWRHGSRSVSGYDMLPANTRLRDVHAVASDRSADLAEARA